MHDSRLHGLPSEPASKHAGGVGSPRALTVAELCLRLADFEGDEPVYDSAFRPVRSVERMTLSCGTYAILSESPEPQPPRLEMPRWWRAVVEALRGLASTRVRRGALGSVREGW